MLMFLKSSDILNNMKIAKIDLNFIRLIKFYKTIKTQAIKISPMFYRTCLMLKYVYVIA